MLVLDTDEHIIAEIHKHWYNFSLRSCVLLVLAVIPPVLISIFGKFIPASIPEQVMSGLSLIYIIWLLILWISLFISWTLHYLSAWVITNKRVINIDQDSLFARNVSSVNYDRIQEIRTSTTGVIPTMLNFGILTIESAAENTSFILHDVQNPEHVKLLIEQQITASHKGL